MLEQHGQTTDQLAPFAAPHALDLLGDMFDVGGRKLPGAEKRGLLVGPSVEIAVVKGASIAPRGLGHQLVTDRPGPQGRSG